MDEHLKLKYAVLNGGDDYYSAYLQMGAVSLSSPAFKGKII